MNAKVQLACPTCGPVEIDAATISVARRLDAIDATYRFECSQCGAPITRHANPDDAVLLLRAGAHVELRPSVTDDVVIMLTDEAEIPTDTSS